MKRQNNKKTRNILIFFYEKANFEPKYQLKHSQNLQKRLAKIYFFIDERHMVDISIFSLKVNYYLSLIAHKISFWTFVPEKSLFKHSNFLLISKLRDQIESQEKT
jgi:hypothetical protein